MTEKQIQEVVVPSISPKEEDLGWCSAKEIRVPEVLYRDKKG